MSKPWWKAQATGEGTGELLLYGDIGDGWWTDNNAKDFIKSIKDLGDLKSLTIRINSYGGDVFAGQAIYSFLKSISAEKVVRVDGIAASIASVVAMAGDRVVVPKNAMVMIHNPWSFAGGEAKDMRKVADLLDKLRDQIALVYSDKTGKDLDELRSLMDEETWMTGEEAVDMGFADETGEEIQVAASARGGVFRLTSKAGAAVAKLEDLRKFKNKDVLQALYPNADFADEETAPEEGGPEIPPPGGEDEDKEVEGMDLDELRAKYPELCAALEAEGAKGERSRLQALDELCEPGIEDVIFKAKYEEPRDARDCALDILKAKRASDSLKNREKDAAVLDGVKPGTGDMPSADDRDREALMANVRKFSAGARASARTSVKGVA